MQLSEFRDLLANDGFAATFQTMGQYRTELLRALDGLRAQADARPIGKVLSEEEMGIGYDRRTGPVLWFGTPKPGLIYTHPEASAPGLSERMREWIEEAVDYVNSATMSPSLEREGRAFLTRASAATAQADDDLSTKDFQSPNELERCPFCGGKACMKEVLDGDRAVGYRAHCANFWCTGWQPCLTSQTPEVAASVWNKRHSAATVGEASGWKPAHELSQNHPLRVAERAAQQQAEPNHTALTLPYESALSELIGKIDPDLDTGDILADAKTASIQLDSLQAEPCPECNGSKTVTFAGDACPVCAQQAESSADAVGGLKAQATITLRQAESLLQFFGGHDAEVAIAQYEGGLIAWCTECPEEGSFWLGKTEVDDELADKGRPQAAQQQAEPHPSQAHPTFQTVSVPNGPGTPSAQTFDRRIACKAGQPEWKSCEQQAEPGADEPEDDDGPGYEVSAENAKRVLRNTGYGELAKFVGCAAQFGQRAAVAEGWQLVPVEPTEEMLRAADEGDREYSVRNFGDGVVVRQGPYDHWVAMLAAAPTQQQEG